MLEGTMRLLNPIFSVTNVLKSYTGKLMLSHFSPEGIIKKFHHSIVDWTKLIDSFPGEIRDIIIRLRKGVIQVNLNHQGLESTGKLLVLGILASSLIISSALLWTSKAPPLFNDISIFGGIGFITAFVLVLFIISKLLKSKKD
jgi:ubiquinone biosynthesis protein